MESPVLLDPALAGPSSLVSRNGPSPTDLTIGLHPLAILNISDFYTRSHFTTTELLGGLIGKQTGRDVSIEQTFEFKVTNGQIDEEILSTKLEQFKECFAELEFVGWFYIKLRPPYEPTEDLLAVHKYLAAFHNDTPPLLMIFNPNPEHVADQKLPITVFDTVIDDYGKPKFLELQVRIESFEAEHIAVLYVAKQDRMFIDAPSAGSGNNNTPALKSKTKERPSGTTVNDNAEEIIALLNGQANAVKMLHSRLEILQKYLSRISTTEESAWTASDFEILRKVDALVGSLSTENLEEIAMGQQFDGLLVALLGLVTKGVKYGVELNNKRQVLDPFDRRGVVHGRGM
ncbi:uncharacterized protein V1518DRAFT_421470 [Limtongia smithiae]|uniref:uncharacterized protein n=1 Tax=Limtongia smithiae TaxID=1125753 RepID=UPI0034CF2625